MKPPPSLEATIAAYDPGRPLARATTIPAAWYTDPRVHELENDTVFRRGWLFAARLDQLSEPGRFVSTRVGGQPLVLTRDAGGQLHAFYNVCRHHAAAVACEPQGSCSVLRCPYHGWTYALDGRLKGAPEFGGVQDFEPGASGLVPVRVATWSAFVFVSLDEDAMALEDWLGSLPARCEALGLERMRFHERRTYTLACNWKVFVDNYLDGGYHVPHVHRGLAGVLDYSGYRIENDGRLCVQSSPLDRAGADTDTARVRGGDMAWYFWMYPTFMLNCYAGLADTNIVRPLGVDRTEVIFDFFFDEAAFEPDARALSVGVGERIQQEDIDVCESVQRGLGSRAYDTGRLSVRREAGEHLFHRLLHADLAAGLAH